MKRKIFTAPLQLKAEGEGEPGEFTAVFSTLSVIDLHGDVTEPGAFADGQAVVIEPWNHGWTLPAGKGVIKADAQNAWVEGVFFLDTEVGKENYQTVKNLGDLAEWSYTFDILEAASGEFDGQPVQFLRKLDVVGVGPVTRGAGIDTRTIGIKSTEKAEKTAAGDGDASNGDAGDGEGEGGGGDTAGKPRGVSPQAIRVQVEILEIEAGLP